MHGLVTSNFDNDSIKIKQGSMYILLSNHKSMDYVRALKGIYFGVSGHILPKFKLTQGFLHFLVICKFIKIGSMATAKKLRHRYVDPQGQVTL